MNIKTKYNIGDKVWYYIEERNQYAWGKVKTIEVRVGSLRVDGIFYNIENRFYKKPDYSLPQPLPQYSDYQTNAILTFRQADIFANTDKLKKHIEKQHKIKMNDLSELKKRRGLFK